MKAGLPHVFPEMGSVGYKCQQLKCSKVLCVCGATNELEAI